MPIIKYASDLHLEFSNSINPILEPLWNFEKEENQDYYLALLGDIGKPSHPLLAEFLELVQPHYQYIFYVPGNHEYYCVDGEGSKDKDSIFNELSEICKKFNNLILMDNTCFETESIKFIGCTLWTYVPKNGYAVQILINDYRFIYCLDDEGFKSNICIEDTNRWNRESIEFIKRETNNTSKSVIVLTHHAPLFCDSKKNILTCDPKYEHRTGYMVYLNHAFHNDLKKLIKSPIQVWLYGHTHYVSQFKFQDVIIATNQCGYPGESMRVKFDPNAQIKLN